MWERRWRVTTARIRVLNGQPLHRYLGGRVIRPTSARRWMKPTLLLYSTSTWLAYSVAEQFYGGIHFAWCSPVYDGRSADAHVNIPPSSSPAALYRTMLEDTGRGDRHSESIKRNTAGISVERRPGA